MQEKLEGFNHPNIHRAIRKDFLTRKMTKTRRKKEK